MKKIIFALFLFFCIENTFASCYNFTSQTTVSLTAGDKSIIQSKDFWLSTSGVAYDYWIFTTSPWASNPQSTIGFGGNTLNQISGGYSYSSCQGVDYLGNGQKNRIIHYTQSSYSCYSSTGVLNDTRTPVVGSGAYNNPQYIYMNSNVPGVTGQICVSGSSPLESCTDGIKNQNETSVDYGGVCGTCSDGIQQINVTNPEAYGVDYGGRCSSEVKLSGCNTQNLRYIGTNPTVYSIGGYTGFVDIKTSSGQAEGNTKHDMLFYNPSNQNEYTGISMIYGPLTQANTGALFSTGFGWFNIKNAYNSNSFYGVDTQISVEDYPGYTRSFNGIRLWVGTSYVMNRNADGSPMAPGYANFSGKSIGVSSKNYPLLYTGGYLYATYDRNNYNANEVLIYPITIPLSFAKIELLNSTQSGSFTACGNGVYTCQWRLRDPTSYECVSSYNASGTPQGICTASGNTCMPATSTGYFDGAIGLPDGTFKPTYDASGATVGVDYIGVGEGIFVCEIRSGFDGIGDALKCPLTVISNIWDKISKFFGTLFGYFTKFLQIGGSYNGSGTTNNTNLLGFFFPVAYGAFESSTEPSFLSGSNWKGTATGITGGILESIDNFGEKTDALHNLVVYLYYTIIAMLIIGVIIFIFSMFS